jgi:LysM repeat protein
MRPILTISAVVLLHLGVIAVLVGVNGCRTTTGFEKTGDLGAFSGVAGTSSGVAIAPAPAATGGLNEVPEPVTAAPRPVVQAVGPGGTHTVVKGESLYVIARREGLSVAQLAAANSLELNAVLRIGQKLTIPSKDFTAPATAKPTDVVPTSGNAPAAPGTPAAPNPLALPPGGFGGFGEGSAAPVAPVAPAAPAAPVAPAPTPAAPAAGPAGLPPGGFGGFGEGSR